MDETLDRPITALRALADAARAAGDDASAAAWRRRACAARQADVHDWRAYGDALAALGFAGRAAAAWRRAGIAAIPAAPAAAPHPIDPAGVQFYLSARQPKPDETDRAQLARTIGTSDYSYGFAMRGFIEGLAQIGLPHAILRDPEGIADIRTRSPAACNIHLAFYPPEHLRLLKGACNVACVAWEFDRLRLPGEVTSAHAFADQATMLSLPDALWVPSAHGAAAIARGVAKPVHVVPSPVLADLRPGARHGLPAADRVAASAAKLGAITWQPLAILPRLQAVMNHTADLHRHDLAHILGAITAEAPPKIFVTVLNVHDYRKQIRPMLEGFAAFAETHRDALLLVKASTPARGVEPINSFLLMEQLFEAGGRSRPIVSDRIWITDDVLTREEMGHLYGLASFYLCTAHAEGQNLPLLEAMARGVVPVSVDHTAMADYIAPDNAVTIRSVRRPFDLRLSRRYGMSGLETNFVEADDVADALDRATALSPADYATRALAAHATVRERYGAARLLQALRPLIATARANAHIQGAIDG